MPICNDCKMVSEVGVVCSQACLDAIKAFQERIKEDVPYPARHPWISRKAIKGFLAAAILLLVAYGILCFRAGRILSPEDVLDQLDTWVRYIFVFF